MTEKGTDIIFSKKEFWEWMYHKKALSDELLHTIKTTFDYKESTHISTLEEKPYEFKNITICITFPITSTYSFVSQLILSQYDEKGDFDEILYLKNKEEYYVLGWINCHQHSNAFRYEEFQVITQHIQQSYANKALKNAVYIYLARFVGLTNEKHAISLINEVSNGYQTLCSIQEELKFQITKIEPYGKEIMPMYHPGLTMKLKNIKIDKHPISFHINEGAKWKKNTNKNYQLEGFASNSTRSPLFDDKTTAAIDIEDVHAVLDDYKFPYKEWKELLTSINTN